MTLQRKALFLTHVQTVKCLQVITVTETNSILNIRVGLSPYGFLTHSHRLALSDKYGEPERSNTMQLKKAPANRKILRKHTKHNRSKKKTNNQKKNKKPNQQATQNRSVFWGDIKVTKQLWECQTPKYAKNCTKRCKKQRVHQCCEGGNYACNVLFNHIHIIL